MGEASASRAKWEWAPSSPFFSLPEGPILNPAESEERRRVDRFLDEVERHSRDTFLHRPDVVLLLTASRHLEGAFDQATFYAKFITKASGILKRPAAEDLSRLGTEYKEKLTAALNILRELAGRMSGDDGRSFTSRYLAPAPENLERLLDLFRDLSLIKNFNLDKERQRARGE